MEKPFWLERWEAGEIGFHQREVHPALPKYFSKKPPCKIWVPLCGKSRDLLWLADRGHQVIGTECSEIACRSFFEEAGVSFKIEKHQSHEVYRSSQIEIWCGDHFDFPLERLEGLSGIYDRAALVALPPEMRRIYSQKLLAGLSHVSTNNFTMLLITFEYDQSQVDGPPFSVESSEVQKLFGSKLKLKELERIQAQDLARNPRFRELSSMEMPVEIFYELSL